MSSPPYSTVQDIPTETWMELPENIQQELIQEYGARWSEPSEQEVEGLRARMVEAVGGGDVVANKKGKAKAKQQQEELSDEELDMEALRKFANKDKGGSNNNVVKTANQAMVNNKPQQHIRSTTTKSSNKPAAPIRRLDATLAASAALKSTEALLAAGASTRSTSEVPPPPIPAPAAATAPQPAPNPLPTTPPLTTQEIKALIATARQSRSMTDLSRALNEAIRIKDDKLALIAQVDLGLAQFDAGLLRDSIVNLKIALGAARHVGIHEQQIRGIATALQRSYLELGDRDNAKRVQEFMSSRGGGEDDKAAAAAAVVPKSIWDPLPAGMAKQMKDAMKDGLHDQHLSTLKLTIATLTQSLEHRAAVVNYKDALGVTPVMMAAARGDVPFLEQLVSYEADVFAMDDIGTTALIWACRFGGVAACEYLLSVGCTFQEHDLVEDETSQWLPVVMAHFRTRVA